MNKVENLYLTDLALGQNLRLCRIFNICLIFFTNRNRIPYFVFRMQSVISPFVLRCQQFSTVVKRRFSNRSGAAAESAVRGRVEVMRARLLYQSRKRGIRENDILIGGFAEQHLAKLDEQELVQYDRIINGQHNEWELFHFFSGAKEAPTELSENVIFKRMRRHFMTQKPAQSL